VLVSGIAFQLVYNRAVTGSALELPYLLHTRQYQVAPVLWTGTAEPPKTYRNEALRLQHAVWDPATYQYLRGLTAAERAGYLAARLMENLGAIAPVAAWLPFAFLFWRDRRLRLLLAMLLAGAAVLSLETWIYPHYLAPWFPLALLAGMAALGRMRGLRWRGRPAGAAAAWLLLGLAFGGAALRAAAEIHYFLHPVRFSVGRERARLAAALEARAGNHVVIVRYAPSHDATREWVYNGADIDGARVAWARDRGAEENRRLLRYYAGRSFWLWQPDAAPSSFQPYSD
jgi:hypothetical protein